MRVLWIAPNGGNYKNNILKGTGGWIGALQVELLKYFPELELGIVFPAHETNIVQDGNISYYPLQICTGNKLVRYLKNYFVSNIIIDRIFVKKVLKIIEEFHPDLVHVWGTESMYASVIPFIKYPFIVHIQGFTTEIVKRYIPNDFTISDLIKCDLPIRYFCKLGSFHQYKVMKYQALRELRVSSYVKYWIGRTDWDYDISQFLSPGSIYYHCNELMRVDFNNSLWSYHYNGTLFIQSTITDSWYKGIDVILKTAKVLLENQISFIWNVYGVNVSSRILRRISNKLSITPDSVNVHFWGRVDGERIRNGLLQSDVYVHPSYIENSSNAIAESMMIGVPTIALSVGGNSSMLKENSGILVSPTNIINLANYISQMSDKEIAKSFSSRALMVSKDRQNSAKTISDLVQIYNKVLNAYKS